MKQTPFTTFFEEADAQMISFVDYNMPLYVSGIVDEHLAVRKKVGLFDVSYMGKILIKGKNAVHLIQLLTCNDIHRLSVGKVQYTCILNYEGGIIDDLLIYRFNENEFFLVINAKNTEKVITWCKNIAKEQNLDKNIFLHNNTEKLCQLAIQGPLAMQLMQKLTTTPILDMKPFTFRKLSLAKVNNVILSTTGYTGAGGCELYFDKNDGETIWKQILNAGKKYELKLCGLGARDILRIEAGMMLHGNDINSETTPLEASLNWLVKFTENNNFIGRNILEKQKNNGIDKYLVGFEMIENGIPRKDYIIYDKNGKDIGKVTSGAVSRFLNKKIGIGYINCKNKKNEVPIFIKIRNKLIEAKIVKLPFYKKN